MPIPPPLHSLPIFVRLFGRPVILIGEGEAADAKRRVLERAGAVVVTQGSAQLAIVAVDDDAEAEAAVASLRARGILVNAVDRPALCDFTLPAIVDRDPVLIAVGTGGASAGLAKILRQRIEVMLPPSVGPLASALFAARAAIKARWPDGGQRRRALDAALAPGGMLDPVAGTHDVGAWLQSGNATGDRTVALALSTGDPDDLTLKQARLLGEADRVYATSDVPPAILARARADAVRITGTVPARPGSGLTLAIRMGTS
ncbi:NAD(P)-dependent oxidoreductase [Sphingomonas sp.]|uniref:precorrin-2 dehydrogenase/sirohydrochlorin ferrochelatase family protein n=1 Tax=Sphingomonas sp. TaxID=28214 RepID=UPI0025EEC5B7|nr:NAD(P)-dependent oxidoreductase [Sphingomonas sp.]